MAGCHVLSTPHEDSLNTLSATVVLAACGLGFGLAIAPVNAALLAHTAAEVHGLASGLLVVARMVGMLIGISALTTIGLRAFHHATSKIAPVEEICGSTQSCAAYATALQDAGVSQLQAVFAGAAIAAFIAATLAFWLLRDTANVTS